jgi:hypothetical protein
MKILNFTPKQLAVFGEFLRLGYADAQDLKRLEELSRLILLDIETTRALAHENRIWTNVIAIIIETPSLYRTLDSAQQNEFKELYMGNWRTAELIKRQLAELSNELMSSNTAPILMIKGGLRLYDGLYPTLTHRYMADLDLVFTDRQVLKACAKLGYQAEKASELDLENATQKYLDWQKTRDHHLRPIFAPNHPRHLELHQQLVHLRAVKFCRSETIERGREIAGLPKILAPNMVDQIILNILHTKYGDMFTDYSNFRLRNIFEGYLLFHKLTPAEQAEFEQHFHSIDRHDDVIFWKFLCLRLLDAQEFAGNYSLRIKVKFILHARFGQNSRVNAILYSSHFIYRVICKDLWSSQGRGTLWLKITDGDKRDRFWNKIKRILKR